MTWLEIKIFDQNFSNLFVFYEAGYPSPLFSWLAGQLQGHEPQLGRLQAIGHTRRGQHLFFVINTIHFPIKNKVFKFISLSQLLMSFSRAEECDIKYEMDKAYDELVSRSLGGCH